MIGAFHRTEGQRAQDIRHRRAEAQRRGAAAAFHRALSPAACVSAAKVAAVRGEKNSTRSKPPLFQRFVTVAGDSESAGRAS